MTDERTDRIRELERRISEWESEQSVTIQHERDGQRELHKTLSLTLRIVAAGSIPSVLWIIFWCLRKFENPPSLWGLVPLFWSLLLYGAMAFASARAGGLAVYWWFRRTNGFGRLPTIFAALAVSAILFGWTIFFMR